MKRYHFATIDSTQLFARQFIHEALSESILITSSIQTHGIAQREKTWESPLGNLYLSYVTYLPHMNPLYIAQIVALALVYVLHTYMIFPKIKWVNDLLLDDKKLGGILCENHEQVYIIGVGLNVNSENIKTSQSTISLKQAMAQEYNTEELLDRIVLSLKTLNHFKIFNINRHPE